MTSFSAVDVAGAAAWTAASLMFALAAWWSGRQSDGEAVAFVAQAARNAGVHRTQADRMLNEGVNSDINALDRFAVANGMLTNWVIEG